MKCRRSLLMASSLVMSIGALTAPVQASPWQHDASIYAIYDFNDVKGSLLQEEELSEGSLIYLRRIKAAAEVSYNDKFSFSVAAEYKEPDKKSSLDELFIGYKMTDKIEWTLGKFKEPLGLENQLSLRHQPLLERSTPTQAFLFGRNDGVAVAVEYDTWTLNLALTEREAESKRYDDSYAQILRATYAPLHTKKKFIHLGFDYSTRKGIEDQYDINEPVLAAGLDNLIHSPNFAAEKINLMGFEFAARYHHLLLQSEYFEQTIKREAIVDQSMNGYYVMAVYTLLGDERDYKHGKLKFTKKNTHTLEIATRYSSTELTPIFQGDDADVTSIALNYYYQKYLRLSLEYQDVEVLSSGRTKTKELSGKSIAGRVQLAF